MTVLARYIRNGFSSALVFSLPGLTKVRAASVAFLNDARLLPRHEAYIHERLRRSQAVQETVKTNKVSGIVCLQEPGTPPRIFSLTECFQKS